MVILRAYPSPSGGSILMDEAIEIVSKVWKVYTNQQSLQRLWKMANQLLGEAVPQLCRSSVSSDNKVMKVADESNGLSSQGRSCTHGQYWYSFGYSVNGVAYLHTDFKEYRKLNNFYSYDPEKFNNKTNGITFKCWLMSVQPELSAYITELNGEG